jgi:F0F1-type ATP synthase epsilon subunit
MLARTKPGAVVQKALRHATPDVTNLYVHIGMGEVREAVNGLPVLTTEATPEPDADDDRIAALEAQLEAGLAELRELRAKRAAEASKGRPRAGA